MPTISSKLCVFKDLAERFIAGMRRTIHSSGTQDGDQDRLIQSRGKFAIVELHALVALPISINAKSFSGMDYVYD